MRRLSRPSVWLGLLVLGLTVSIESACAARGIRNRTQVAALSIGELALELDKQERTLYAANIAGYDKAAHDRVGAAILRVLYAARGFERAAAAWPEGAPTPETVTQARAALNTAMADFSQALPAVEAVRDPLNRALAALRAALETPVGAQGLPGGIMSFMALMNVLASLVQSGKTTYDRLREFAKQEGATPEQLASIDARLSDAIEAREAERAAGSQAPGQ